jgi:YidB-like protein
MASKMPSMTHFWDCSRLRATKTATKSPRCSRAQEQPETSPAALRNRVWAACSVTWVERARRAAWEVFWAALLVNCSNDSSRAVRERLLSRGVSDGPNKEIAPPQLKQAIGADVLTALEKQTGLSQDELLARLSRELPPAVDKYTPDGRLPGQNT